MADPVCMQSVCPIPVDAAHKLRARLNEEFDGVVPPKGLEADGEAGDNPEAKNFAMHPEGLRQMSDLHQRGDAADVANAATDHDVADLAEIVPARAAAENVSAVASSGRVPRQSQ